MTIQTVRRLAADILSVGENKIRINPDSIKEAEGALTRSDVKGLIEKGIVTKLKPQGRASTGKTGRRGHGKRKGHPLDQKEVWMDKVRSQRRLLVTLVTSGVLKKDAKRAIYRKVKSGIFRNKKAMLLYLKENKLVPAEYEIVKPEFKKAAKKAEAKPKAKPEQRAPEHKAPEHAKKGEHK